MILVTGATGHIGNVLVRELKSKRARVRALLMPGEDRAPLEGLKVEIVEGNVLDYPAMRSAMRGVKTVYHLAGLITIMPGRDPLVGLVNVQGTKNVLAAAMDAGVERLVYTSSIHAIARVPDSITIDESVPFDPQGLDSEYDSSKAMATLAVLEAAHNGLEAVVVCPTGVIGPYDYRLSEMGRLIFDAARSKLQFSVDGAYDFVDVRDVAQGLI
jgi:dihydroflavonol-4-reductase